MEKINEMDIVATDATAILLKRLSDISGVSGREQAAVEYAKTLLADCGTCEVTPLGSLVCTVRAPKEGQDCILLAAHIDEIGLVVTYIEDSGFLRVAACGGIDRRLLIASQVTVHTSNGEKLPGIVCSIPPHISTDDKKNPKIEEIYIDVGFDAKTAREKIMLGDVITLHSKAKELLGGTVSGKALDDRAGCAALISVAHQLKNCDLPCGVVVTLCSMEEVGSQGAKTVAQQVLPTHAIAVDVSFAHTPDTPRHKCGKIGDGPMLGIAPILNRDMLIKMQAVCKEKNIPYQLEVMGGNTSTDADKIAVSGNGVKTALISIPQKYMHTPIEVVATSDVDAVARLIAEYIKGGL